MKFRPYERNQYKILRLRREIEIANPFFRNEQEEWQVFRRMSHLLSPKAFRTERPVNQVKKHEARVPRFEYVERSAEVIRCDGLDADFFDIFGDRAARVLLVADNEHAWHGRHVPEQNCVICCVISKWSRSNMYYRSRGGFVQVRLRTWKKRGTSVHLPTKIDFLNFKHPPATVMTTQK